MAVHWRAGFNRLFVVIGAGYWITAALVTAYVWLDNMSPWDEVRQTDTWRWDYFFYAGGEAFMTLLGWAVAYVVAAALLRGARWVARGFTEGGATEA